jgi:hypothetical protein
MNARINPFIKTILSMKQLFLGLLASILFSPLYAQTTQTITVNGDGDKFYPVTIKDEGWWSMMSATELEIGRPDIHENSSVRGSMLAKFSFHVSNWGHGTKFINADLHQSTYGTHHDFIAGWADASEGNPDRNIVIWLKGGGTTYYLKSNFTLIVGVYDVSPYVTPNGASYGHKTQVDAYVNANGSSNTGSLYLFGSENSVIMGKLGLGTNVVSNNISLPHVDASEAPVGISWYTSVSGDPTLYGIHRTAGAWTHPTYQQLRLGWLAGLVLDPGTEYTKSYVDIQGNGLRVSSGSVGIGTLNTGDYKLAVEGTIGARKVKVTQQAWADYVFDGNYKRLSLSELENYIRINRHLPGIPTEAEVKKDGVDVGEMNKKLLEKIEELTLYLIELKKEVELLKKK